MKARRLFKFGDCNLSEFPDGQIGGRTSSLPALPGTQPLVAADREPAGCNNLTFPCEKCGQSRTVKAADPMKSNAVGWLTGELKPPV
jgi:hypothetical protein